MIPTIKLKNLRNPEHLQFITDGNKLFLAHNLDPEELASLYQALTGQVKLEEEAMAVERSNEKIKEKNKADAYRDKLHSKLFNHLKTILYDSEDPKYAAAQRIMNVIKSVGNPTHLSENAESALITTLGNKLESYTADLETADAKETLDKLLTANREFMKIESECRQLESTKSLSGIASMTVLRKQTDVIYRRIVAAINTFSDLHPEKEDYRTLIADMSILVEKYDRMISQHKKGE